MNTLDLKIGLYGRMQIEMIAVKLLDENGVPKPTKRMSMKQQDAVKIYDFLSEELKGVSAKDLNERATETNLVVKQLINEDTLVNNYLLSMMLYRRYLQEEADKIEQGLMLPKVQRLIGEYENLIGENFIKIRKTTARVTDNIWRVYTGKAQLSDEIRDILAAKMNIKKGN